MIRYLILVLLLAISPIFGIEDVPKTDSTYPAVKNVVEKGYFSTFDDGKKFMPDKPVTRKEMALILDKVIRKTELKQPLTRTEMQELSKLSKTFKTYLVSHQTGASNYDQKFGTLETEQSVLHHDLTQLTDELNTLKEDNKVQQNWIWGLLGVALLGLAI